MMKLSTLFSTLLLVAAAFAAPSEPGQGAVKRRDVFAEAERDGVYYDTNTENFSGAQKRAPDGQTWTRITGRVKTPTPNAPAGAPRGKYSGGGWVGIQGDLGLLLQAGVTWNVDTSSGSPVRTYSVWTEWFPGPSAMVPNFPVTGGDRVYIEVTALSPTSGRVYFFNERTGQKVTTFLNPPSGRSMYAVTAEWIVEDFVVNGNPVPFARYGTSEISICRATTAAGATVDASGSSILDMVKNGVKVSDATLVNGSYVGFRSP